MFHATGGEHLNSDDYFKSRALIKRRICIKELEKEKEEIEERMNRANERDLLIQEKGKNLTQETKKDFKLPEIKILLKWKVSKIPPGNKAALIQLYFDTPDPEEIMAWSKMQENKLLTVKQDHIDMKDTALAVSANQMDRGVSNNIKLLNTPEKNILIDKLREKNDMTPDEMGPEIGDSGFD